MLKSWARSYVWKFPIFFSTASISRSNVASKPSYPRKFLVLFLFSTSSFWDREHRTSLSTWVKPTPEDPNPEPKEPKVKRSVKNYLHSFKKVIKWLDRMEKFGKEWDNLIGDVSSAYIRDDRIPSRQMNGREWTFFQNVHSLPFICREGMRSSRLYASVAKVTIEDMHENRREELGEGSERRDGCSENEFHHQGTHGTFPEYS